MSWSATKYAWKCSHKNAKGEQLVKGSTKLFMLAVAFKILPNQYESEPLSLRDFHALTGIRDRQLRASRRILIGLGELEQRGVHVSTYVFPKMLGPLFATPGGRLQSGKTYRVSRQNMPNSAAEIAAQIGLNAGGVLSLDPSSTNVRTTTADEAEAVEVFLDWFIAEYPLQRHGALYVVTNPVTTEAAARKLLNGRSVVRVQNMARAMFSEKHDRFILDSDYSVHVLEHKAMRLEKTAIEHERRDVVMRPMKPDWKCPTCDKYNPAPLNTCICGEGRPVQREASA